jgi:uncharacterized protein GlcG (DUF336 family)
MTTLDLNLAARAASAALARATALGVAITVVVVDARGETVTMSRQDGALIISPSFAAKKAFAAVVFGSGTHDIVAAQDPLQAIRIMTTDSRLSFAPGGIPFVFGDEVIGAIGVAGGRPDQDLDCCEAGLSAIGSQALDSA